jgi:pSer/pThr/pTyr-binding forkhead associated (FHA) protein
MAPLTLIAINGGKQYPLAKDMILIGRQDLCDIHIDHKSVSKQHCLILIRGDRLWLRDLGSTNGCHVNGKRVRRSEVKLSDIIGVAGFNFRLTSKEARKKPVKTDAGTTKLNQDEIKRLEEGIRPKPSSSIGDTGQPVVRVNTLPDEYTPVQEEE